MKRIERLRKIALRDFYGIGKHVYEDELGWRLEMKKEAGSVVSRDIFFSQVVEVGLNLAFYYIDNDTFYGIHRERFPIECKILPRDRSELFLGWQCRADTHDDGEVVASFDNEYDIWDGLRIDGKPLEEVLRRSYVMGLY